MASKDQASKIVREEVLKLIEQKEVLENEIKELQNILTKNHVGMDDPLVDEEGFPLANVDVYQVRHARHLIIHKQNDYITLMKQVEDGIAHYYGTQSNANTSNGKGKKHHNGNTDDDSKSEKVENLQPFAAINIVHDGSPADSAGIRQGDQIVEFGSINCSNFRGIEDIGAVVKHSHGNAINVKLKRGERFVHVQILPRKWNGRGLLGCNVVPM